jgi:hypothetical protein
MQGGSIWLWAGLALVAVLLIMPLVYHMWDWMLDRWF